MTCPELEELMDLFQDRSEEELQAILVRHGGNLDETVDAICNGERALINGFNKRSNASAVHGSIKHDGEMHISAAGFKKDDMGSDQDGIPHYIPWGMQGSHEQGALDRTSGEQREPLKKKEKRRRETGIGPFGTLGASDNRRPSSRRRGMEEEGLDSGSLPVPTAGTSSRSGMMGDQVDDTNSNADSGEQLVEQECDTNSNADTGACRVGAFPIDGPGIPGMDEAPAAGAGAADATNSNDQQSDLHIANAVTNDELEENLRQELRSEIRREMQNNIAAAQVVESRYGETWYSQWTCPGNRPCWHSRYFWVAITMVLVGAVGGLTGVLVSGQSSSGSPTGTNTGGGNPPVGTTLVPTDPPTVGAPPELSPTSSPVHTAPTVPPTGIPQEQPPPTSTPVGTTLPPTPPPTTPPSPNPTPNPTPPPSPNPTPPPPTRPPIRPPTQSPSRRPSTLSPVRRPPTRNPTRRPTRHPTTTRSPTPEPPVSQPISFPTPAFPTPCYDRYGGNILVCFEISNQCSFYLLLNGQSCQDYCSSRGGNCLRVLENDPVDVCLGSTFTSCNAKGNTDNVCACTL